MKTYSTAQAAKKLGLPTGTLARYIAVGKLPAPAILTVGTASLHAWTDEQIKEARKLLPKIANGRKTRWQKVREKQRAQAGVPVPQRKRKPRTKKKK